MTTPCPGGRDSGPHGPGFLFHGRLHPGGSGVSDISSAGMAGVAPGYGKTCRQDVLRGVDVPVMPGTAGRALPHPGAPAVRDRLRQPTVADHVPHREILQDDHVMVADQAGGGLVQEVGAGGADLAVSPGGFGPGFGAVGGSLLAAGHPLLVAGQVTGPPFQVPQRDGRHLIHPGQFVRGLHGGQVGARLGVRRTGLVGVVPLTSPVQGPVPGDADAAECAVKQAGLRLVGVCPAFVRGPHGQKSYSSRSRYVNVTRREGDRRFVSA